MKEKDQIIEETIARYRNGAFNPDAACSKYLPSGKVRRIRFSRIITYSAVAAAVAVAVILPIRTGSRRLTEYAAGAGPRTIVLPDRTSVTLSAGSSLKFKAKEFAACRNVALDGKAIFTVTHDSEHPFAVAVGNAIVKDLGTEFQIDGQGSSITVDVFSGKVLFAGKDNLDAGIAMTAGMHATLEKESDVPRICVKEILNPSAWADGRFRYENAPVSEVLKDLAHCYNVKLSASDTSAVLTGTFEASGLEEVVRIIGTALDIEIQKVLK